MSKQKASASNGAITAEHAAEYKRLVEAGAEPGRDTMQRARANVARQQQRPATPTSPGPPAAPARRPRERSAIGVNVQLQPQQTTVPLATGHGLSFWAVVLVGLLLIALTGATGHWSGGFWVALLVLVLVGAIYPPAALLVGGAALLWLTLTHGKQFLANISALVSPPQPAQGGKTA